MTAFRKQVGLGMVFLITSGATAQDTEDNESPSSATVHTVREGDTLWDITSRYVGNPYEWPRIWSYNASITNPHWIYPHDRVRLVAEGETAASLPAGASEREARRLNPGAVWLRSQGFLDATALETAGEIVGSPEEQMLLSTWDEVYVRFENAPSDIVGKEYSIFRTMQDVERASGDEGELVRIFGAVRFTSYDAERGVARATIVDALDPIERGFRLAAIPRRFEMVPARQNERNLTAQVVAALLPTHLSASEQVIFINAGSEQGVALGNRLVVTREGDAWQQALETNRARYGEVAPTEAEGNYPIEVVAEGRVVDVRPNSSTLLITTATREVERGDRVEMRSGF